MILYYRTLTDLLEVFRDLLDDWLQLLASSLQFTDLFICFLSEQQQLLSAQIQQYTLFHFFFHSPFQFFSPPTLLGEYDLCFLINIQLHGKLNSEMA